MDMTEDELQALNSIYVKYKVVCKSLSTCRDCPMDFIVDDYSEHCLERGCLLASIEYALAKYK